MPFTLWSKAGISQNEGTHAVLTKLKGISILCLLGFFDLFPRLLSSEYVQYPWPPCLSASLTLEGEAPKYLAAVIHGFYGSFDDHT